MKIQTQGLQRPDPDLCPVPIAFVQDEIVPFTRHSTSYHLPGFLALLLGNVADVPNSSEFGEMAL